MWQGSCFNGPGPQEGYAYRGAVEYGLCQLARENLP